MKNLTLGVWNMGYMTGIWGGSDYVRRFPRFIKGAPPQVRRQVFESFKQLLKEEQPDILFLMEIRDYPELRRIAKDEYELIRIDSKYLGVGWMSKMPGVRKNCNGFLARKNYKYTVRSLSSGSKKLLYAVDVSKDTCLLLGHFALSKKKRAKQFAEISKLLPNKKLIVAGDFNIFDGNTELTSLLKERNLKVANRAQHKTYPTKKPRHALDLVLAEKGVASNMKVREDITTSDHLPVFCNLALAT